MATNYLDNYYARLGLAKSASTEEIRNAYHQAARRLHPDARRDPGSTEFFLRIQEAYEVLSDKSKRAKYDSTLPDDIDAPADIMVNTVYSRPILPTIDDPQLVYVLMDLMSKPAKEQLTTRPRPKINVCLVLDNSTSMKGSRMDVVITSAIALIKQLKSKDILSIVAFNDFAEVVVPATVGLDYERVEARIRKLQASGGTEIYKGLETGLREVKRHLSPSHVNHLILITDGRTYDDEQDSIDLAGGAAELGITISGLGVGSQWNDQFLDHLAGKTGGNSLFAAEATEIRKLLEQKFSGLYQVYASQVSLEFSTPPNVDLRYAFRLSPETGPLVIESPLYLGNIPIGPRLTIIMEFMVHSIPAEESDLTLAEGRLKMQIPSRVIPATDIRFSLKRPTAPQPELEAPPLVLVDAMSRLSLYRLQEQARDEIADGEIEKATKRLNELATQLLASGQEGLAKTILLETEKLKTLGSFSEGAEKQIKYGTRALLLPSELKESM